MQVGYDPRETWRAYAFAQDTLSKTENREDNGRIGVGSSYRFGERLRMDMEVSDGDLGPGGRLGTNYLVSDRPACTSTMRWRTSAPTTDVRTAPAAT